MQCDGKCVICDSYVRPSTLVRICDECTHSNTCVVGIAYDMPLTISTNASSSISLILTTFTVAAPIGNYGSYEGRCVICGGPGISDAYYCRECTQEEKDRDGCPKIVNLGASKTDLFYERKKYGFKRYVTTPSYAIYRVLVIKMKKALIKAGEGNKSECAYFMCCSEVLISPLVLFTGDEVGD